MAKVGIVGAGGWGTALAVMLRQNGHEVTMWEFDAGLARRMNRQRRNPVFLPGIRIPGDIVVTNDLPAVVTGRDMLLMAVPSHAMRSVCERMKDNDIGKAVVISCSKGIENHTLLRMTEVLLKTLPGLKPGRLAVLSGPSHAEEVARGIPTVVVAASGYASTAGQVQSLFMNPVFRVYTCEDTVGVELGGALKNIIAIAAGISDGVGFGDNTKAALMTRGMVEITRLGTALGANALTFAGLSGMGDLFVTCTSCHSRNRFVGEQIGRGKTLQQVLEKMVMVAEGVRTTESVLDLARKHQVHMPITEQVFRVLFEEKPPEQAVHDLMTRDPKAEDWG